MRYQGSRPQSNFHGRANEEGKNDKERNKTNPAVAGSTAMLPAKTAAEITSVIMTTERGVRESRLSRPRLNLSRSSDSGNNDMTVSHTSENLVHIGQLDNIH